MWVAIKLDFFFFFWWGGGGHVWSTLRRRLRLGIVCFFRGGGGYTHI